MKRTKRRPPPADQALARNARYHRRFALLAAMQAKNVLPLFEAERPDDARPRHAIEAIQAWARAKRELGMAEVRRLSLGAHAAARQCQRDAARFAARAAGHAVATWHVPTHAMGVPIYACKAILASERTTIRTTKDKHRPSGPSRRRPGRATEC